MPISEYIPFTMHISVFNRQVDDLYLLYNKCFIVLKCEMCVPLPCLSLVLSLTLCLYQPTGPLFKGKGVGAYMKYKKFEIVLEVIWQMSITKEI